MSNKRRKRWDALLGAAIAMFGLGLAFADMRPTGIPVVVLVVGTFLLSHSLGYLEALDDVMAVFKGES